MMYSAYKLNKQGDNIQPIYMNIYKSHELQLLSPCAAAIETCVPRAHTLQQEKPYNEKFTHCNKDPAQQKLRKKKMHHITGVE